MGSSQILSGAIVAGRIWKEHDTYRVFGLLCVPGGGNIGRNVGKKKGADLP